MKRTQRVCAANTWKHARIAQRRRHCWSHQQRLKDGVDGRLPRVCHRGRYNYAIGGDNYLHHFVAANDQLLVGLLVGRIQRVEQIAAHRELQPVPFSLEENIPTLEENAVGPGDGGKITRDRSIRIPANIVNMASPVCHLQAAGEHKVYHHKGWRAPILQPGCRADKVDQPPFVQWLQPAVWHSYD